MRYDPTSKALFLATDSSVAICKDASNTAGISGCVVDSAGGLLVQPFDVLVNDDTLWGEYRVGCLSWRIALPAQPQACRLCWLCLGTSPGGGRPLYMRASSLCPTGAVMCACQSRRARSEQLSFRYPASRLAVALVSHPSLPLLPSAAVADRGVNSLTTGDGWIVRCDIVGLSTASPSLACCTKVWGTNTTGSSGSDGNNVSWGRVGRNCSLLLVPLCAGAAPPACLLARQRLPRPEGVKRARQPWSCYHIVRLRQV